MSCARRAGPRGRWLRCSSSTYLEIRLRRRALPAATTAPRGRAHDFGHGTLDSPTAASCGMVPAPSPRIGSSRPPLGTITLRASTTHPTNLLSPGTGTVNQIFATVERQRRVMLWLGGGGLAA